MTYLQVKYNQSDEDYNSKDEARGLHLLFVLGVVDQKGSHQHSEAFAALDQILEQKVHALYRLEGGVHAAVGKNPR